ncbi:MAG: hypothetical protein FJ096_09060 [Deltaproteobacteria bacterium]|nr:hypothetical protein [Deltaproteobacteria bacterium]
MQTHLVKGTRTALVPARLRLFAACVLLAACKKDTDPVDVPFDGPDALAQRKKPSAPEASSAPSADRSSTAAGGVVLQGEGRPGYAGPSATGGIAACCAVLRANSRTAKDEAARSNLTAAANACETQRAQLDQGKVTRAQALTAVRLSLLDTAPPACR